MSLTYATYVEAIETATAIPATDAEFQTILPNAIDYAELRILRELNPQALTTNDGSATFTPDSKLFTLPTFYGRFVTVTGINVVGGGLVPPYTGTQHVPLTRVPRQMIDFLYPYDTHQTSVSYPLVYAMLSESIAMVGPPPNGVYNAEVIGTFRPPSLSAATPGTVLSTHFPDLLVAASMIFMSGYMKNFGAQADDPKQAQSWESQFQALMSTAKAEEKRKQFSLSG